jgi:hypothetical protein
VKDDVKMNTQIASEEMLKKLRPFSSPTFSSSALFIINIIIFFVFFFFS